MKMPLRAIFMEAGKLPGRTTADVGIPAGQILTRAAYDLYLSGRKDSAARIGALLPAMVAGPSADDVFGRLDKAARPEHRPAFDASRAMLSKGYVAEAADLLVDSGAVSADELWASVDREIAAPSVKLEPTSKINFAMRSLVGRLTQPRLAPPGVSLPELESVAEEELDGLAAGNGNRERANGDRDKAATEGAIESVGGGAEKEFERGEPESAAQEEPGATAGEAPPAPDRAEAATDRGTEAPAPLGPTFFFELRGEREGIAKGDEVVWGEKFDLLFRYGLLPEHALAGVRGERFKRVVSGEVVLGVEVIPKGLKVRDRIFRLVRFVDGKMVDEPAVFAMEAPSRGEDKESGPRGVYVNFTILGAVIYGRFFEIKLVDKLSDGPRAPPIIDLDLQEVSGTKIEHPRVARLTIRAKGGGWEIFGGKAPDYDEFMGESTGIVNEASVEQAYKEFVDDFKAVASDSAWKSMKPSLDVGKDQEQALLAAMKKTMAAGNKLYSRLEKDAVFKQVLDFIENLPEGSRITIKTDKAVFPWELFYRHTYVDGKPPENFKPEDFWGQRYLIETVMLPTRKGEKPPRRQEGKLRITMGMNATIDTTSPWAERDPPRPVKVQADYFEATLKDRGDYFSGYDDISNQIIAKAASGTLIYFFCHGAAKELEFDASKQKVTPDHVRVGPPYPGSPVVFINACDAADISPLTLSDFRTEFGRRNAAGVIAPSFPVPTMFAAVFAKAFLEAYLKQQPVGEILFNLRRELVKKNNPLGLWYSLQCPVDVTAPEL